MKTNKEDIQALKRFVDQADDETSFALDIMEWMWDNRAKINFPQLRDQQFEMEILTFLQLIGAKEQEYIYGTHTL